MEMEMEMEVEMERISRTRWRNSRGQRPCHPRGVVIRHACEHVRFMCWRICAWIFSADDRLKYIYPYVGYDFREKKRYSSTFRHGLIPTSRHSLTMYISPLRFHASTIEEDFSFFYGGTIFKFSRALHTRVTPKSETQQKYHVFFFLP